MIHIKYLLIILTFTTSYQALGKESFKVPLNYRAQKNHIRVFAQRFDYKVVDPSQLKVGHTLTSFSTFSITFKTNPNDKIDFNINWPSSLIKEGIVVLKDNNGKALIYKEFFKNEAQFNLNPHPDEKDIIDEVGTLIIKDQELDILEQISYLPYMTLCVYRINKSTPINICSDELYLNQKKKPYEIKARTNTKEQLTVDINGKAVGPQGYIFLTQSDESVFLKAQKNTGAYLEIQTQFYPVDFIDVSLTVIDQMKFLEITGKGLSPYDSKDNFSNNPLFWKTRIPYSYPIMYLFGGGGIPLRQEFFIKEDPPNENLRIYLEDSSFFKTYKSEVQFKGLKKENIDLSSENKKNTLLPLKKNYFHWKILDLEKGKENIAELELNSAGKKYVPSTTIYRGFPWMLNLDLNGLGPEKRISTEIKLQKWFDTLFGLKNTYLKTGIELQYDKYLSSTVYKFDLYSLHLKYRMNAEMQLEGSSWGFDVIPFAQLQFPTKSTTMTGLGIFIDHEVPQFLEWSGDRIFANVEYYLISDSSLISNFSKAYFKILVSPFNNHYFDYGFGVHIIGEQTEPEIKMGWTIKF